jgi:uncharacterized protein DUF6978
MARVALTDQQITTILAAPKTVNEDLKWRTRPNASWAGCTLAVENDLKMTVQLNANVNLVDRSKYSFALIVSGSYRVAGFDAGGSHVNRHTDNNKWVSASHKHRWTERCRDSFAYTPADIDESSVETAFRSFCNEVGVEFHGSVDSVPVTQTAMDF